MSIFYGGVSGVGKELTRTGSQSSGIQAYIKTHRTTATISIHRIEEEPNKNILIFRVIDDSTNQILFEKESVIE